MSPLGALGTSGLGALGTHKAAAAAAANNNNESGVDTPESSPNESDYNSFLFYHGGHSGSPSGLQGSCLLCSLRIGNYWP